MSDLRAMVRELLAEELAVLKATSTNEKNRSETQVESVRVSSDDDLNRFALQVLETARKRDLKTQLQNGSFRFILQNQKSSEPLGRSAMFDEKLSASRENEVSLVKSLITEKDIAKLGGHVIRVEHNACFTPLAKDEIRRRGIKIERNPK